MQIKIPERKTQKRQSQADMIRKKKEKQQDPIEVAPAPIVEAVRKTKTPKAGKTNFTLLLTKEEDDLLRAKAEEEGRGVSPFVLRLLKQKGLFNSDDIFLGNVVTSGKSKQITIKLTAEEHMRIEEIKELEGRSKNEVVSMFLYQQFFKENS